MILVKEGKRRRGRRRKKTKYIYVSIK